MGHENIKNAFLSKVSNKKLYRILYKIRKYNIGEKMIFVLYTKCRSL